MTFDEWKFFFIAYVSVLSTVSIVWNIRDAVRKNRGYLRIDYGVSTEIAFDNYGKIHGGEK